MLEDTIRELPTDDKGRFAIDEARAAGFVVGVDTLLIGTISTTGNGYFVDAEQLMSIPATVWWKYRKNLRR